MNASDLKPAGQLAKFYGVKALVFGGAGSGKTPIFNTAPRPLLLAVEPGMLSMGLRTKAPIGAGSFMPGSIMVVGEQTSHPGENKYHAPFCSAKACSGWLNRLLNSVDIPEAKLYWVNALDNDGTEVDLSKLALAIEPKAVIALGNIARDQLKKHKLEHRHVPHPQYWKRFRNKEAYPLIEILKELCNDQP